MKQLPTNKAVPGPREAERDVPGDAVQIGQFDRENPKDV